MYCLSLILSTLFQSWCLIGLMGRVCNTGVHGLSNSRKPLRRYTATDMAFDLSASRQSCVFLYPPFFSIMEASLVFFGPLLLNAWWVY